MLMSGYAARTISAHSARVKDKEVNMENHNTLTDRRDFLKKTIQGAGLAFAVPAILSSLGSGVLHAQASGPAGGAAGMPYGTDDGRSM
jgi:hypothetical protein